jgi:cell division protein FtsN
MRKILWRAAIIVPLLSVLAIVSVKTDLLKSRVESSNLNPLVTAEFEQNKNAVDAEMKQAQAAPVSDTVDLSAGQPENKPETKPVNTGMSQPAVVAPSVEKPAPVTAVNDQYFLVTGSFRSEANAISQVNSLKKEGFAPEIVVAPNGFYRVYAMACNDLGTAKFRKDSIAGKFPGAWITRNKQ